MRVIQRLRSAVLIVIPGLAVSGCQGSDPESQALVSGDACTSESTLLSADDPLAACQWPLTNTGQSAFSTGTGVATWDINLQGALDAGYTGTGVVIAVSDTGLQLTHPDLAANVVAGLSRNYRGTSPTPPYTGDPSPSGSGGDHGTSVSGIIAAVKDNGIGGRGVASSAGLAGLNWLSASSQTTAILLDQAQGSFDIHNQSWGYNAVSSVTIESAYRDQLESQVETARSGKGAIYVKAAGNAFGDGINCNGDPYNTTPYTIVVAASNADGVASSYSSACSAIWITAPGGEFGTDSPAVVTTDVSGCSRGYSQNDTSGGTSFQKGRLSVNDGCDYTHTFNGTSSATPHVAGVVALMLEANPNLTWRDVKHVLASTARQIHADVPAVGVNLFGLGTVPSGHVWETAWTTNAAGYKFHNWYGFGLVDADAAASAAASYSTNLGSYVDLRLANGSWNYTSGAISAAIPDNSATGVTRTLAVAENITIENVQVRVSVTHPYVGDVGVELTSPSGTKSILFNVNHGFATSNNLTNHVFLTNAFYGEASNGTWTLKVIDGAAGDTGTLTNWQINVGGHSGTFSGF